MSPGEYLYLRLFGSSTCSVSMASGTGMYHHAEDRWDPEVLGLLGLGVEQFNPIVDTLLPVRGLAPEYAERLQALRGAPWYPAAGDGACSNLGSDCTTPNRIAVMVGTSGAMRVMLEPNPRSGREVDPPEGLWKYRLDRRRYLLGGALSNGGNLFAWLQDSLRLPEPAELNARLAALPADGHGLTMLPFLAGERCPGWRGDARAAVVGLSWNTRPEEILRAGLESVAYRFGLIHDLLRAALPTASEEAGAAGEAEEVEVVASGGALAQSRLWTQIITDALGVPVSLSAIGEASARGAALLALEGAGLSAAVEPASTVEAFLPDRLNHEKYREGARRQQALYQVLIQQAWSP
jgi:gluconokinase